MKASDYHTEDRLNEVKDNEFGDVAYWDVRYEKARSSYGLDYTYEWFLSTAEVEPHITMHFGEYESPRILIIGCGSSAVGEFMQKAGYHDVTNIDWSQVVIHDMLERYRTSEGMQFIVCDVRNMDIFPDASFDIVFDKGCIDAVFASLRGARDAMRALAEVSRVLAPKGRVLSYSYSPPEARLLHVKTPSLQWEVDSMFVGGDSSTYLYVMRSTKPEKDLSELAEGSDDEDTFTARRG